MYQNEDLTHQTPDPKNHLRSWKTEAKNVLAGSYPIDGRHTRLNEPL